MARAINIRVLVGGFTLTTAGFAAFPAAAQSPAAPPAISQTEYGCSIKVARPDTYSTSLLLGPENIVTAEFPVWIASADNDRIAGHANASFRESAVVVAARGAPPPHQQSLFFTLGGGEARPGMVAYLGRLTISGDGAIVDWLARGPTSWDVRYGGKAVTTIDIAGIDAARKQLAACRPIQPPPNRAVAPIGDSRRWLDVASYADAARGEPLLASAATLTVDRLGRVEQCSIASSSGNSRVDERLCRDLTRKGRFKAATDAQGRHIGATYRFTLPAIVTRNP